jgi:hypothetical protein
VRGRENYVDGVLREKWDDQTLTYQEFWGAPGAPTFTRPYTDTEKAEAAKRSREDERVQNKKDLLASISTGIEEILADNAVIKATGEGLTATNLDSPAKLVVAFQKVLTWQYKSNQKLAALARVVADSVDDTNVG